MESYERVARNDCEIADSYELRWHRGNTLPLDGTRSADAVDNSMKATIMNRTLFLCRFHDHSLGPE